MLLQLHIDLSEAQRLLTERNKVNKIENNQVEIRQTAVGADIYLADMDCVVGTFPITPELNHYFQYRSVYPGILDVNRSRLQVITNVRLHGHTGYSLLDGMIHIRDLVEKTPYGCAITDHGVLYGAVDFYKKMKAQHKYPIIGFEAYTEARNGEKARNHLILLAKNATGYQNLVKLASLAQGNFHRRPLVTHEWLQTYAEGVICLSACLGGELPRAVLSGQMEEAEELIHYFKGIYGADYYIEIQRHGIEEIKDSSHTEETLNQVLIQLAQKHQVPVIATDDAHYMNPEDSIIHEAHLCIRPKHTMSNPKRWRFPGTGYHVHTCEEMEQKFKDIPEALVNSLDVIEKCRFEFEFGNYKLPHFEKPEGYTDTTYLEKVTWEGFEKRFPKGTPEHDSQEYRERLTFELDVIARMGYPSYFLITWDFIKYAKEQNIAVGPGRGSACGSLVAYALEITNLDPIPYNLLFERFLNPDRISMPDIDIDFNHERRAEVIEYCREKYGFEAVSRIATFGTLSAKAAILDMSRVWDKPLSLARKINKMIPNVPGITIAKALQQAPDLASLYQTDIEVRDIIDKARQIEGLPRNVSVHACGVVIADGDVMNYCPQVVLTDDQGEPVRATQFTMGEVEEIGLLKMDFLGLKTMTILQDSVDTIAYVHGKALTIDEIPLNDPFVYEHIAKGKTTGVFQLEGGGMTSFMTQLYQDVKKELGLINRLGDSIERTSELALFGDQLFERLIAGVSLYRPGPMDGATRF